jgi:hypothetical protein
MSKNKDIDKKLEKEFDKKIEAKEIDKRKELKIEIKEKPEKIEIKERKEFKEFKEKLEIKERIKEFKELEKKIFEKGGKEIVEVPDLPGGELFRAEKPEEGAVAAKPEELKQKEMEKIKPEKEFPDKIQKELEKIKPEKEFEKYKEKELEKFKPEKEFPDKLQKELEKFKPEKEFEKGIVETQQDPTTRPFKGTGSAEDRLGELEDAVTRLSHFIGVDLRPDLTTGALKGEPDTGTGGGEAKPDDKKKPK